jgi:hypothetical protein
MWLVPRSEIPTGDDEGCEWLNRWWQELDAWIDQHRLEGVTGDDGGT